MSRLLMDKSIEALAAQLRTFAKERNWEQFHTAKNLVLALVGEVGELAEIYQWLTDDEAVQALKHPEKKQHIEHELADVLLYLIRLADIQGIDLFAAASNKISINAVKYPIDQSFGHAQKLDL